MRGAVVDTPGDDATRSDGAARRSGELYRTFVPRRARRVAYAVAGAQLVILTVIALILPGSGPVAFAWYDRAEMIVLGVAIAVVLWRFGRVSARPDRTRLEVRNLVRTTRLDWAQIVAVHFGGGGPWVMLDLTDGDSLAVMAVQRADGAAAEGEARRLATLVALHSGTERDD